MKVHSLKTWPIVFNEVIKGKKRFEYRLNDRDFKKYDYLLLKEFNPDTQEYTGRELKVLVTYIIYGGLFGIPENYCIMSI